jgi:hypothetical protein
MKKNNESNKRSKIDDKIKFDSYINNPKVYFALYRKKRINYDFITNSNKFKQTNLNQTKDENTQKILKNLNKFRKNFLIFNKKFKKQSNIINDLNKQNHFFNHSYNNIKNSKKFNTYSYIDKEWLFTIANEYNNKGYLIPEINTIFNNNPLIVNKKKLNEFFISNDNKNFNKFINFLNKIQRKLGDKLNENNIYLKKNDDLIEEKKSKNDLKSSLNPKNLIPILKDQINKTNESLINLKESKIRILKKKTNNSSINESKQNLSSLINEKMSKSLKNFHKINKNSRNIENNLYLRNTKKEFKNSVFLNRSNSINDNLKKNMRNNKFLNNNSINSFSTSLDKSSYIENIFKKTSNNFEKSNLYKNEISEYFKSKNINVDKKINLNNNYNNIIRLRNMFFYRDIIEKDKLIRKKEKILNFNYDSNSERIVKNNDKLKNIFEEYFEKFKNIAYIKKYENN